MQIKNKGIVGLAVGLAAGLAIGVVVSLQAGPLTPPPTAVSGGAPVSTMRTLDQVTPTWDRTLPANDTGDPCNSSRFTCVMGGAAVRDNETGLVWEHTPSSSAFSWNGALNHCTTKASGNRLGWQLPTIQELASLVDRNNPTGNPDLPPGHPFVNVASSTYWSATIVFSSTVGTNRGWVLFFNDGTPGNAADGNFFAWCVRGGRGADVQ